MFNLFLMLTLILILICMAIVLATVKEPRSYQKFFLFLLLPLQIIVFMLSPRFDWTIHKADATILPYAGTFYEDGALHCIYEIGVDNVDISYGNIFSKKFDITVNYNDHYSMEVKVDGASVSSEQDMLPGIANDIVWQDSLGIFYWRLILSVAMTLLGIYLFLRAERCDAFFESGMRIALYAGALGGYFVSLLISLRAIG